MADEIKQDPAAENVQKSQFKQLPTIYNLTEIVDRCFEEAEKAGFVSVGDTGKYSVIEQRKLCNHIALTIVGELRELEIIRKLQPIIRMWPSLQNDFAELDRAQSLDFRARNLRREPTENDF